MRASWLLLCSLLRLENSSGNPSKACFFHCAICVGCTPYSAAISLAVWCPLMASRATLAKRLVTVMFSRCWHVSLLVCLSREGLFYLNDLSRKLGPLYPV